MVALILTTLLLLHVRRNLLSTQKKEQGNAYKLYFSYYEAAQATQQEGSAIHAFHQPLIDYSS